MKDGLDALEGVQAPSLKDFWVWVKRNFTTSYQAEVEAYLADSTDHADVERRMRILQRRGMI
jgi:hypothetical protein